MKPRFFRLGPEYKICCITSFNNYWSFIVVLKEAINNLNKLNFVSSFISTAASNPVIEWLMFNFLSDIVLSSNLKQVITRIIGYLCFSFPRLKATQSEPQESTNQKQENIVIALQWNETKHIA
jgi:hypothetical protein